MSTVEDEFTEELKAAIALGGQVVPRPDGTEERIRFEQMDRDTRSRFLYAAADFTDFVNRGMDPAAGDAIIERFLNQ